MKTSTYTGPKYPKAYWDARKEVERLAQCLCDAYEAIERETLKDTGRLPTAEALQSDPIVTRLGELMQEQGRIARELHKAVNA